MLVDQGQAKTKARKYLDWLEESLKASQSWREETIKNYKLVEGDKAEHFGNTATLNKILKRKQPANVWNIVLPKIEILSGLANSQPLDIHTFARGYDDDTVNEIMNAQIKYISDVNDINFQIAAWFDDAAICGEGWMEVLHETEYSEDLLYGDVYAGRVFPLAIFDDPFHTRYDGQDMRYCFKAMWVPLDTAQQITGKRITPHQINSYMDQQRLAGVPLFIRNELYDTQRMLVRLLYCYYSVPGETYFVFNLKNQEHIQVDTEDEAKELASNIALMFGGDFVTILKTKSRKIKVTTMVGDQIVDEDDADQKHRMYPFVKLVARQFTQDNKFGLVSPIRDPQLEINKRMAQNLRIMNSGVNSGWTSPKGTLDELTRRQLINGEDVQLIEFDATKGKPERIQPAQLSQAHSEAVSTSKTFIDFISGIMPELAGQVEGVAVSGVPGKAVNARQQGSMISISRFMRNLASSKKLLGKLLVKTAQEKHPIDKIQQIMGYRKALGDKFSFNFKDEEAIAKMKTSKLIPYDVAVDLSPASTTARQAQFIQAIQLMQVGIPVDPEILIELADLPMKDKVKQALKEKGLGPQNPDLQNLVNQAKGSADGGGGLAQ